MKILLTGLKLSISVASFIFFLGGCSSKSYFEPDKIAAKIEYDGSLPSKIIDSTRDGATLENGQIITKSGLQDFKIEKNYRFVWGDEDKIIAASNDGILRIYEKNGEISFEKKFDDQIASASIKNGLLAIILGSNSVILMDSKSQKIEFQEKLENSVALDSRLANPYFFSDLAVFPTLDGKLLIVDIKSKKIVRNIVIGSNKFFNNVIFLDVIENRLVAATKNRVISINPKSVNFMDIDVKDIVFIENRVFVLTKDSRIVLADSDLKKLKERKYPFANFSGAIFGKYFYGIEKTGYLIATDTDLISSNIFQMPSKIETFVFNTKDTIYYNDKFFKLNR